jgi:two-component system, NtrC family, C4-dicarboxylate transport sensor histidine kinase DctB
VRRACAAHFYAWLDTLDGDMRQAMVSPSTWLGVAILAALVICSAGLFPPGREVFHLRVVDAAWAFLPTIVLGLSLGIQNLRGKVGLAVFGICCIVGSTLFQFFMWSLVSLSELPGAIMMASFPLLLAAFHGYMFRSSPKHPYIALGTIVAVLLASLWNRDQHHVAIYLVAAPVAVGVSAVLGHIAQQASMARIASIALREAVDAQILSERMQQQEALSTALLKLHGTHHDAGNALSGMLFNLQQLSVEVQRTPLDERRCRNIGQMSHDLLISFERLRKLLLSARNEAGGPILEPVDVGQCLEQAAAEARLRFSRQEIEVLRPMKVVSMMIPAGSVTLQRLLSNIVTNACEGNGTQTARRVLLRLAESAVGSPLLEVVDNGPGFSEERLKAPFRPFHTTKAGGSGLGLYTSHRLIQACGGSLSLRNAEHGLGAVVQIELPSREPR